MPVMPQSILLERLRQDDIKIKDILGYGGSQLSIGSKNLTIPHRIEEQALTEQSQELPVGHSAPSPSNFPASDAAPTDY